MTEDEWLGSSDTALMVAYLQGRASDRKLRLLACAYARRAWWQWLTSERSKEAIVVAERYADGRATLQELENAAMAAAMPSRRRTPLSPPSIEFDLDYREEEFSASAPWYAAHCAANATTTRSLYGKGTAAWFAAQLAREALAAAMVQQAGIVHTSHPRWEAERENQERLLRQPIYDLFGNPFRSLPVIDPAWLEWHDGVVVRLAGAAYEERESPLGRLDSTRLAVLADAVEEVGCRDEGLLSHLRQQEAFHTRGCWATDLLLGLA